jgi:nitrite reductase (NADH) small subunit
MAFVKVFSLAKLPLDDVVEVMVGATPIALCHTRAGIQAIGGICPHQGGPLGHGAIHDGNVVCPWHAWEFSCESGRNDFDPDTRVPTYPVQLDGDDILVDPGA